jgi:mannose-1-phosphate guanylyltransferase/phosphomannomutase
MSAKLAEAFGAQIPAGSTVIVGRDHHKSSRMLKRAFVGGMLAAGINVVDLKSIPSSVLRFNLSNRSDYTAGVYFRQDRDDTTTTVITFYNDEALRINSDLAKKIEKAYFKETFRRVDFSQIGHVEESHRLEECINYKESMVNSYQKRLFSCVDCRIAVDMMHGLASDILPSLLKDLAIDNVIFNNYHDAHRLANFKSLVKRSTEDMENIVTALKLDAGFMLYPFGQRVDIVCDNGTVLSMQAALQVVLKLMDMEGAKEGKKRVFLPTWAPDLIQYSNLEIDRGKYANFTTKQLQQYDLIATVDGNFAFTEFSVYRDSMYATIKILEMIIKHDVKLSNLVKEVEEFYYHQTQIACTQALKGKMMRKFLEDAKGKRSSSTDGVKIWLNETDWILMIPDQYSDHLNLFIQAKDEANGKAIIKEYEEKINSWAKA